MEKTHDNVQLVSSFLEDFKGITSAHELRRTLELEMKGKPVRIEVWYWHSNPKCPWVARVHTRSGKSETWKEWPEFPWVEQRDEGSAIHDALDFIGDRT
jgi:hypothetical protein